MKVNKKFRKIIKKIIKPYNLAIFGCIILISVSMFVIFKPDKNNTSTENSKDSNTKTEIIKSDEKGSYVYVGKKEKRYIKLGLEGDDFTEVTQGLNPGDIVYD